MKTAALVVLFGFLAPSLLHAEAVIESVHWQWAPPANGQTHPYEDIAILTASPPRLEGRLRARVTLTNNGPQDVDGILLVYCLAARLVPTAASGEGVWAVPFMIEEKRVPKIGPNQQLDVFLDPSRSVEMPLQHYLQHTQRAGFWPDQLKLQVMLQPRPGTVSVVKTLKVILPIRKPGQ